MPHISVPIENTMEYISVTEVSPLISKVKIKVCYVGQEANRNGTVITKETATKLARGLPGCPIVGYYNEEKQDFEAHNREVVIKDGKYKLLDTTKPYGFVNVGAPVWFEKFNDDGVEHEYLCVEGYVWTSIYEESKRIIEKGNNQSMELNDEYEKGFWSNDNNSNKRIFIINDGLIEKLCILGSDVEPCFEGASIKSFDLVNPEFNAFKAKMFSMIAELKDALHEGGYKTTMEDEKNTPQLEEDTTNFEKKKEDEEEEKDKKTDSGENNSDDSNKSEEDDKEKKEKKNYELNEIAEYVALQLQYSELQSKYAALEKEHKTLTEEANELRSFKLAASRKEKEAMVDSFYMLSDADKKDVVDHLDTYSLDDIEAKLSIICVRNKVNFNLEDSKNDEKESTQQYMLNLQNEQPGNNDDAPAWVRAVRAKG